MSGSFDQMPLPSRFGKDMVDATNAQTRRDVEAAREATAAKRARSESRGRRGLLSRLFRRAG